MNPLHTVAIDARRNTWAPQYGISRYARNLIRAVQLVAPSDLRVRPVDLAGSSIWRDANPIEVRNGHGLLRRAMQEQVDIPRRARDFDLLHLCWYEGPFLPRRPHVVAVHDLDTVENPEHYRLRFRAYYNALLRTYVRSAARILVPSQSTEEAVRHRWPRARVAVVPLGVDPIFTPRGPRYTHVGQDTRVIAYTGGYNGRKRLNDLIRAFEDLCASRDDVVLLMTGVPPEELRVQLAGSPAADRIRSTGYLDNQTMASVYRAADVVVYPSSLEGFGFPVVEAFASGAPVVATATGSIPELAGDAAFLVDLGDVHGLAEAIRRVLDTPDVAETLRKAGLIRASLFGWDRTADGTLACWREVLD